MEGDEGNPKGGYLIGGEFIDTLHPGVDIAKGHPAQQTRYFDGGFQFGRISAGQGEDGKGRIVL